MSAAAYVARRALTPDKQKPADTEIHAVDSDSVTLGLTADGGPGRYGLWLDDAQGHCRVGEIIEVDEEAGRVRRELLGVDYGWLTPGFAGGTSTTSAPLPTGPSGCRLVTWRSSPSWGPPQRGSSRRRGPRPGGPSSSTAGVLGARSASVR